MKHTRHRARHLSLVWLFAAHSGVGAGGAAHEVTSAQATQPDNAIVRWNQALLTGIKDARLSPPVVSHILATVHTCMYDAWSAYDAHAYGVRFNPKGRDRQPATERPAAQQEQAVHRAALLCASALLPKASPSFVALHQTLTQHLPAGTGAAVGEQAARVGLAHVSQDGSNALGQAVCKPPAKNAAYCDDTGYAPKNPGAWPIEAVDPNRWQPLPNGAEPQTPLAPHWGRVQGFSIADSRRYLKQHPIPKGRMPKNHGSRAYLAQIEASIEHSRLLAEDPTGEQKAIVEYWADGPFSYLPPGHFSKLAQFVARRDSLDLAASVKLFFALNNAALDVGIVVWQLKYQFDYVRPITAVRYVKRDTLVYSWGGPETPWEPRTHIATGRPWGYNRYVLGRDWLPYNPTNNPNHPLTPAFPEFPSGHSAFSAASAQVLKMMTGSPRFGYVATYDPFAPEWTPTLVESPQLIGVHRWHYPSFKSAANQAGWSRRFGGIHFEDGDRVARHYGKLIGHRVWQTAQHHFLGDRQPGACLPQARCPFPDTIPDGALQWETLR
jgi:membrane-associated phospholipid phosphatase